MPGPAGNVYDKYATTNPVERRLVGAFLSDLEELVEHSGAREAHEVGCGEGELTLRLARRGMRIRGSDSAAAVIAEARRRAVDAGEAIDFRTAAVEDLVAERDSAELIICCEVMEHLDDPAVALDVIAELARPWALFSVPREPIWRALNLARLKYVSELGNTPGHLQHFSRRAFLGTLDDRFEVTAVRSPLPWSMALCRVR